MQEKLNKTAFLALACACLCVAIATFQKSYPIVLSFDLQRDLQMPLEALAMISGFTLVSYGLTQIPTGILTDKYSPRIVLTSYLMIMALCTFSLVFTNSANIALFSRFIIGFALAVTVPSLKLVATICPPEKFASYSSLLIATAPIGSLLASSPLVFASSKIGWRSSLGIVATLTLMCGVLVFILMSSKRNDQSNIKTETSKDTKVEANLSLWQSIIVFTKSRVFWIAFIWFSTMMGVMTSFGAYWFGPYLIQGVGFSALETGNLLVIIAIISLVCMPALVGFIERRGINYRTALIVTTSVAMLSFLPYYIFPKMNFATILVVHSIYSICITASIPILYALCKQLFPIESFGTLTGCLNTSYPILAAPIQIIFGYVLAWRSPNGSPSAEIYSSSFIFFLVIMLIGTVSVFFLPKDKQK